MFKEYDLLIDLETKLNNTCDANNLICKITKQRYPFTIEISPDSSFDGQLTMFEDAEDGEMVCSRDSGLCFSFYDGQLTHKTTGRFIVPDTLFNKFKNLAKKIHYAYLQHFFVNDLRERDLMSSCMAEEIKAMEEMDVIDEEDLLIEPLLDDLQDEE